MAVQTTEEFKNGGATSYAITIEYLKASDIKVRIGGALQTYVASSPSSGEYTVSGTTVTLGAQAAAGSGNVHIYRETDVNTAAAVFAAGSSIRAADLNAIHDMGRFAAVEHRNKIITADIKEGQVTTTELKDGTILTTDIAADQITNALIADNQIDSEHYVDGSIDRVHLEADIIDSTKLADDAVNSEHLVDGSIDHVHLAVDIIDGDNIQNDVINSEHYVAGSIDHEHLANDIIDGDNIQDSVINSEHYVNGSIDREHLAADIVDGTKIADNAVGAEHIQANAVTDSEIATGTLDNRYYTETELNAGQLDNRYYTETEAEGLFLRQDSSETIASGDTWSGLDSKVATTAAIDARIIDLLDDTGGFVPLANETSFPTANPDINNGAGTVVSVKAVSTNLTPSSGTVTIANGAGTGNTVTITGVTGVIPSGFGMILETTSTLHTYAFHRLQAKATEVNAVASNITQVAACGNNLIDIYNFADLYQISTTAPTQRADGSSLQNGDLWYDSSNLVMMVYDGSAGDGFSPITPNQSTITAINTVAGHVTYQEDLGLITDAVNTGSGNNSINTVGANIAAVNTVAADLNETTSEIDTVATNITNVNNVGNSIANVNAVAGNATNINAVNSNATNINAVAANNANITAVKNNEANINAVKNNETNINAVKNNATNINTVAGINANVTTVAGISANVTAVAGNATNINAVKNNSTNINAVNANSSNINTVAGNNTNVSTVAGKATEIGRLGTADAVADMNTLGTTAIVSDLDTCANISSNISTVAGISANVTTVANNNANVTAVAGNATNINTTATNIADVNNFVDRYQISSSAPTQRTDGSSLQNGDLWFNNTSVAMESYDGSAGDGYTPIQPSATVIQNIANVTGFVTFVEDNGLITDAINTGTGNNSINTVGADITNVNTVAGSIANVNTTAGNITNVNTVAGAIANVNTVSGQIANVNRYADEYVIQSSTPSSPSEGDLWYNSTANTLNYYNSSAWVAIAPGISGLVNDANPQLANHLDCNDKNLTEVATISGNNLQLDFGTL